MSTPKSKAHPATCLSEKRAAQPPPLSIVIFAFHEEENIHAVLGELGAWLDAHEPDAEIVFVDDGSRDRTAEEAVKALSHRIHIVLRHDTNGGIGAALKTGVRHAQGTWVTFLPADGQIAPDAIQTLRDAQRAQDVDVVFSVYRQRDDGLDRKVFSFGVRALIRELDWTTAADDQRHLMLSRRRYPGYQPNQPLLQMAQRCAT